MKLFLVGPEGYEFPSVQEKGSQIFDSLHGPLITDRIAALVPVTI